MQYLRIFHYKNTEKGMEQTAGKIYTTDNVENSGDLSEKIQVFLINMLEMFWNPREQEIADLKEVILRF